eukprot:351782-Rhodomonas_salina.1
MSQIRSPGATLSPTLTLYVARLPAVMVGERAGMLRTRCSGSEEKLREDGANAPRSASRLPTRGSAGPDCKNLDFFTQQQAQNIPHKHAAGVFGQESKAGGRERHPAATPRDAILWKPFQPERCRRPCWVSAGRFATVEVS